MSTAASSAKLWKWSECAGVQSTRSSIGGEQWELVDAKKDSMLLLLTSRVKYIIALST